MPQVIRSGVLGYCFGVKRAVEKARSARRAFPDCPVFTWGPLIHNPAALESLKKEGITVLEEGAPVPENAVVVIRAHGIPPASREALGKAAKVLVDATCPRVLASQKKAAELARQGCRVFIAGDKTHAETLAVAGACPDCVILEDRAGAERCAARMTGAQGTALLAQTTIGTREYGEIAGVLRQAFPGLRECGEICPATLERQEALEKLCRDTDGVLVIGGKESANTKRLFAAALEAAENPACRARLAALVESAEEIPPEFFSLERVGLASGASTPEETIAGAEESLSRHSPGLRGD